MRCKRKEIFVVLIFLLVFSFVFKADIGRFTWEKMRIPAVASALVRDDAELFVEIGSYYFLSKHDLNRADGYFKKALTLDPDIQWAHYQLARTAFIRGRFFTALAEIETELALHPGNKRAHYMRGLVYGYRGIKGDLEKAEADFREFVAAFPMNWAGWNDLAWILAKQGKFTGVKETVITALETMEWEKERNVWLWTSLGVAELNLGDYNKAKEAFLNAQKIADTMTAEYFWSAYPGNDRRGAEAAFSQFKASLVFNIGVTYEKLRDFSKAKEYYESYISLLPSGLSLTQEEVEEKINELAAKI